MVERGREEHPPLRVLVVDDNRDAADSLALLVRAWGHEVRVAYDGVEGLRTARAFEPDCMLLDLGLPKLDGFRLAEVLRAQATGRGAKLIALTAFSDKETVNRALEAGFDYHFVKPADPDLIRRLLVMLQKVLKLTEKTEALAKETVELTKETKTLLTDVKQEMKEVKEDIKEVKQELREVKEDLREVRDHKDDDTKSA